MIDLEVLPELMNGTEVGKEGKKRLARFSLSRLSLEISHLELVGSCSFLPRLCSLLASSSM